MMSGVKYTTCKYCEYKSKSKNNVEKHEKCVHENVKEKCGVCGKMVKDVKHHMRYVHEKKEKRLECDKCCYKTNHKGSLTMHIKSVHEKKLTSCPICGKMVTEATLRAHIKCHTERRFSCVPCRKTFRERKDISRHILYVHKNVRNVCTICKKNDVTDMRIHVKTLHGINDFVDTTNDKQMINEICMELNANNKFEYNDDEDLKNKETKLHKIFSPTQSNSISAERKFSCVPCRKTFIEKGKLARHILYVHRNVRNVCPICKKADVTDVKLHVKTLHGIHNFVDTTTDKEMIAEICRDLNERFEYYNDADLKNKDSQLHATFGDMENVKKELIDEEIDASNGHSEFLDDNDEEHFDPSTLCTTTIKIEPIEIIPKDTATGKEMIAEICTDLNERFEYYNDANLTNKDSQLHAIFGDMENIKKELIDEEIDASNGHSEFLVDNDEEVFDPSTRCTTVIKIEPVEIIPKDTATDKEMVAEISTDLNERFKYYNDADLKNKDSQLHAIFGDMKNVKKELIDEEIDASNVHSEFLDDNDEEDFDPPTRCTTSVKIEPTEIIPKDTVTDKEMIAEICTDLNERFEYYNDVDLKNKDSQLHATFSDMKNVKKELVDEEIDASNGYSEFLDDNDEENFDPSTLCTTTIKIEPIEIIPKDTATDKEMISEICTDLNERFEYNNDADLKNKKWSWDHANFDDMENVKKEFIDEEIDALNGHSEFLDDNDEEDFDLSTRCTTAIKIKPIEIIPKDTA